MAKKKATEIKCAFMNASTRLDFRVIKLVWSESSGYQIFRWNAKEMDMYEEEIRDLEDAMQKWNDAVTDNMGDGFMLLGME